jgi:hypothetical protein
MSRIVENLREAKYQKETDMTPVYCLSTAVEFILRTGPINVN